MFQRITCNPLITPEQIPSTIASLRVACVLNPAPIVFGDEILLLLRVIEMPYPEKGWKLVPTLDLDNVTDNEAPRIKLLRFRENDPDLDSHDARVLHYRGRFYLTGISHLRLARSKDGLHFTIDPKPTIQPQGLAENFGIEDSRVTEINGVYYISYCAVSENGYCTALISTRDWIHFKRHGNIFHPNNKDVAIFPGKFGDDFVAFHRPDAGTFQKPSMWLAYSKDLVHWGRHEFLMSPREGMWDSVRLGAGGPPLPTSQGWLEIYHGVSETEVYCLGALLLDAQRPSQILARSAEPLIVPKVDYERNGFYNNTIFSDGAILLPGQPEIMRVYYGAADKVICAADASVEEILQSLTEPVC